MDDNLYNTAFIQLTSANQMDITVDKKVEITILSTRDGTVVFITVGHHLCKELVFEYNYPGSLQS